MIKKDSSPRQLYKQITGLSPVKNGRLTAQYIVWLEIIAAKHFSSPSLPILNQQDIENAQINT